MCQSVFEKSKSFKSYGRMVSGGSYGACCILLNPSWILRRACLAFCYLHINSHLCGSPTFCWLCYSGLLEKGVKYLLRKPCTVLQPLCFFDRASGADTVNRQAVLCHRVLRTLQHVAHHSVIIDRETWQTLLLFLLAINDTLLAPPTIKGIVEILCQKGKLWALITNLTRSCVVVGLEY